MRRVLLTPLAEGLRRVEVCSGVFSPTATSKSGRCRAWLSCTLAPVSHGISALRLQANFQYNNARGGGRPTPMFRGGGPQRFGSGGEGSGAVEYNEPSLVAKLLELFPTGKAWIPISKWSHDLPETLQEPISRFGGLGKFATSQSNFFIVRKENNINVVSLTPMATELCRERAKVIKEREKRNAKLAQRRGRGGGGFGRGRGNFGSGGGRRF